MRLNPSLLVLAALAAALAINRYFPHGYGTIHQGMAGAGTALAQDSIAAATIPAGMAFYSPEEEETVRGEPPWGRARRSGELVPAGGRAEPGLAVLIHHRCAMDRAASRDAGPRAPTKPLPSTPSPI
ncbi:hypothetical protein [Halomonas sp.]|uniref:hypothetical protein n=1 Tax=Halomonas sp. TaxID=1486246 RepID=UPI00298E796D|nr:hypothetical protein [Halomonas sp.]MDW7746177.1 hypothetical protein [Halomonas sp.]